VSGGNGPLPPKSNRLSCGKKEAFERLYADSKRYRENKEKLKEKLLAEAH
jgi:hypothetical protein